MAEKEVEQPGLGMFTDQFVDLDVFAVSPVKFSLTDASGAKHAYTIPMDPPFELALVFMRAHDDLIRERVRFQRLSQAAKEKGLDDLSKVRRRLVEAFREIVALRNPDVSVDELEAFGEAKLSNWMAVVVLRLKTAAGEGMNLQAMLTAVVLGETAPKVKQPQDRKRSTKKSKPRSASHR